MALVAIAVGVSTTPAMVQISSDEAAVLKQLGRDAALLWVVVEKCGDFFFVDKERGHARHDELVRQGMDRRDDLYFLGGLAEGFTAAADDFAAARIDRSWCEKAKAHVIGLSPDIFRQ
jgi:hypothetical protein